MSWRQICFCLLVLFTSTQIKVCGLWRVREQYKTWKTKKKKFFFFFQISKFNIHNAFFNLFISVFMFLFSVYIGVFCFRDLVIHGLNNLFFFFLSTKLMFFLKFKFKLIDCIESMQMKSFFYTFISHVSRVNLLCWHNAKRHTKKTTNRRELKAKHHLQIKIMRRFCVLVFF